LNSEFNFENENINENLENTPPDSFENVTTGQDVDIDLSENSEEINFSQETIVDKQENFSTPQNSPNNTENGQNPPSFQTNYYGYQHSYQPFYQPQYQNPEALKLFFEKKAVKKTAMHIGIGFIFFYAFQFAVSFILAFFMRNKNVSEFFNNSAVNLELNIILSVLGMGLSGLFILKTEGAKASRLVSYGKPKSGSLISAVMVGVGFCYTANIVVSMLQSRLQNILPFSQPEIELPNGALGFLISVLSVAVAPALIEEFLFRSVIMGSLLKYGKSFAIFTSALLFGLVHGNLVQIPFAFMVGLILGAMVVETNSIWTGIIIHFANNFISVCMDYLGRFLDENILNVCYLFLLSSLILIGFFGFYILSVKNQELFSFKKTEHISSSLKRFGWFFSSAPIIIYCVIVFLEILMVQALV